MRIALIVKPGHEDTGVARYARELRGALESSGHEVVVAHPVVPLPRVLVRLVERAFGWDLATFFSNYPVWARYPQADIYHLTSQNLATLLTFRRPNGKTVVTVHDIIPWLVRNDPQLRALDNPVAEWFDRLAMAGLRKADALVFDSAYTEESLHRSGPVSVNR